MARHRHLSLTTSVAKGAYFASLPHEGMIDQTCHAE